MRSRFTAYATGEVDYLVSTEDPPGDRAAIARWVKEARFTGLEVLSLEAGGEDDEEGVVEFRARYIEAGEERLHQERSRFRKIDGRWCFVQGARPKKSESTPGRNDPCPCGSGKKYKKCCGR
jgi:SEC-C motif-containing protein